MPTGANLPFSFEAVNLDSVEVNVVKVFEENIAQFFQVNTHSGSREIRRVGKRVKTQAVSLSDTGEDVKQWSTYAIDLSTLIEPEPGAIYRVTLGFKPEHSLFPCPESSGDSQSALPEVSNRYDYSERDNPCSTSYYHARSQRSVTRNVLASDLGLIAKHSSDDFVYVFVNDLHTTEPLNGVSLEIYDYSQQLIGRGTSDGSGMARIEASSDPFFLVAQKGDQRGYLKIQNGQSLSISRFDVGGESMKSGLRGYLYGERGVWRPGDDIHLTFILDDSERPLPDDHPVEFEFRDPRGQLVDRFIRTESVNNFYAFQTQTATDGITGTYTAKARVGGVSFSMPVKVETIMPNRMKINMNFDAGYLTSETSDNEASIDVQWLHGAVAKNLQANVTAVLTKSSTTFDDYRTLCSLIQAAPIPEKHRPCLTKK